MPTSVHAGRDDGRALVIVRIGLLTGPVVLAFWSGGFFDGPRLWALAGAWSLVFLCVLGSRVPFPRAAAAVTAVLGLAALAGWTAISVGWAPLEDPAQDDLERVLLYLGFVLASTAAWRSRRAARTAELAVAAGALVVTAYGLSGRLVPWLIEQSASASAGGRLEQPLTYWNAQGALAAVGLTLCARIAGDAERATIWRMGAAAAASPLLLGVYLSFSRGAVLALACGLLVLLVCAPTWTQLRAVAICLESGGVALAVGALSPAVRSLDGSAGARDVEGALVFAVLAVTMVAGAWLTRLTTRAERHGRVRAGPLPLPRRGVPAIVAGACLVAIIVPVLVSGADEREPAFGATSSRFTDVGSNRDRYWDVALSSFADHPLAGVGAAGFQVEWLRDRGVAEGVRDAHSLPLETAAELGLVGLLALLAFAGGIAACARRAHREDPVLSAGACAALSTWAVHACLDWDWELPALTLPALTLAALLLARSDPADPGGGASAHPA
jgi:hypothetical protein